MLKNYLIVALRNLLRHRVYSVINLAGLAVGLACAILIGLYIQHEMSYDRHHRYADRIYRVIRETRTGGVNPEFVERVDGALGPVLKNEVPEVRESVRMFRWDVWVRHDEKAFKQVFCLTDENILNVFDFPLLKGDREQIFQEPSSVVMTRAMARKYFGDEDPVGKTVSIESDFFGGVYRVAGILEDIPTTSSISFDLLVSPKNFGREERHWSDWRPHDYPYVETYVLLSGEHPPKGLEARIHEVIRRYIGEKAAETTQYHLQPLTRIHLYSGPAYGITQEGYGASGRFYGSIVNVRIAALVGVFILLSACINFMNLTTARSANRAREVGVRKVVGACRGQLIRQFLCETVLLSLLSVVPAFVMAELSLPAFNRLIDRSLSLYSVIDRGFLGLGLLGIVVAVGVIAGIYPAFYLSAYQAAAVLKGSLTKGKKGSWFRKGLVVFQFSISIAFIVATIIVSKQLGFISRNLGFSKDQIIMSPIFQAANDVKELGPFGIKLKLRFQDVKQAFLRNPNVTKAATSRYILQSYSTHDKFFPEGAVEKPWNARLFSVDEDFFDLYDIPFVAGRNFSKTYTATNEQDRQRAGKEEYFILNETAVKQLGWDNPVGKTLKWGRINGTVIGVVKDFHVRTLHEKIEPVVFNAEHKNMKLIHLKVLPTDLPTTLAFLEKTWKQYIPNRPFEYVFFDEKLNQFYEAEIKLEQVFRVFSLIAIFVACLGLFGLSSFATEQRTKEMGIRKVLGASVSNIVILLSKDFVKLVLVANVIAWPVAYYLMNEWLQNFAYRVSLGFDSLALSGVLALAIALFTVSFQAIKTARSNPVDALRYE